MIQILTLLLICSSVSYAGTIDPSTPDSKYVEYGSQFECVVRVEGKYKDDTLYQGSAVIIDDHHFLTAAHVVTNYKDCTILLKNKKFLIQEVLSHPDFKEESVGFADIAIGYSKEKFNLNFYPSLYDANDEAGKICSISGYGYAGNFNTGAKIYDLKKRAGSNTIDKIDRDLIVCSPSYRHDKDYTQLEFLIASGDSGGALFIDQKVAGINSILMASGKKKTESKYKEESGHTRVSKFVKWIQDNRKK